MSVAGLLIGPIFGLINPQDALGELYSPLISLAVALVLFEGSSSLDIRELKGISKSVLRIITAGVFIAWIGGSLAAHYIAGLNMEVAFMIGGLFVVTGPTVIIPLLRQAKLKQRTASVLKWEGIIVDPVGPLLALFSYMLFKIFATEPFEGSAIIEFIFDCTLAALVGLLIGLLVTLLVSKGLFPEYLKSPITLSFVLLCFTISNMIMGETGMLAVTVMGLTVARSKRYVSSIGNIGHVIENISVILTSTIFILLTASLSREILAAIFSWEILLFVLIMLFLIRPLSIWISTIGTELTSKERTLIGWVAPRGIVALTVAGYFTELLIEDGYADASILTALTFALVFITVCAHGFSIGPLAKKLGLANTEPPGVLIVGASSFSIALANKLKQLGTPVMISDTSRDRLNRAKKLGIVIYVGEILEEHSRFEMDFTPYDFILAMKGDFAYNALVYQTFAPEFGYNHTFILPVGTAEDDKEGGLSSKLESHLLFGRNVTFNELNKQINTGYSLRLANTQLEEQQDLSVINTAGIPLCLRKKDGTLQFITVRNQNNVTIEVEDQLLVLTKNK